MVAELGSGYGSGHDFGFDYELGSLEIRNAEDIRTVSSILFLFLVVYSCPCDAHSPCGTRNTWCYPLSRDLISSESAISGTARFVLHVGLVILRPLVE